MARTSTRDRIIRRNSPVSAGKHGLLNPPGMKSNPNYSHAIIVEPGSRFLVISGQVGRSADGSVPEGIEAQAELAWRNVRTVLEAAGMSMGDIVSYVSYLVRREDAPIYSQARLRALGDARPASTLVFVAGLGESKPTLLCEVQVLAAKAPATRAKPPVRRLPQRGTRRSRSSN